MRESEPTTVGWEVRSVLSGRIRWQVAGLRQRPETARMLARRLEVAGCWGVVANPLTGRVLVLFNPDRRAEELHQILGEVLADLGLAGTPPPSPAMEAGRDGGLARLGSRALVSGATAVAVGALLPGGVTALAVAGLAALGIGVLRAWRRAVGDPAVQILLRRYRGAILRAAAASFALRTLDLMPPVVVGASVSILSSGPSALLAAIGLTTSGSQLLAVGFLASLTWAMEAILDYWQMRLWRQLAQQVSHDLHLTLYQHVQTLDLHYFERRSSGEVLNLLHNDVDKVRQFFESGADDVCQAGTGILAILAAFVLLPSGLAILLLLPLPLTAVMSMAIHRRLQPRFALVRERADRFHRLLADHIAGMASIQSFTAEHQAAAEVEEESQQYMASFRHTVRVAAAFNPAMRLAVLIGFAGAMIYGGLLTASGGLSIGVFAGMVYLSLRVSYPLTRLGASFALLQHGLAALRRIEHNLKTHPTITSGPLVFSPRDLKGTVSFQGVSFAYPGGPPVLEDICFEIPAGRLVAVVGPSGSGKSTLVKLLLRFYDPNRGEILLDGMRLPDLDLLSLRRAVGWVGQDVFLFHTSVRDNIALGREGTGLPEIAASAKRAVADHFIERLPGGYDAQIGERGLKLSAGQRQRIAVARALLKDAPVLILDEATSAMDHRTEENLLHSLAQPGDRRTTLVIAHRLFTIQDADEILVLNEGSICERGSHIDLLRQGGLYASLWQIQIQSGQRRQLEDAD